ncbi:MAG: VWA domain-containing protein [Pseudomonadota bacterium]
MGELHLLRPYWLLSLLPLLLAWWALWRGQDTVAQLKKVVEPHLLEHLIVGERHARRLRPIHLLSAVWIVAAVALAGPAWEREPAPFADDGAGLVVLLKVSGTMKATDVQPSRLERAKHKLHDLLQQRKGTAAGLIVYSGSAHLVMPLTRDDRIVTAMVEDLAPELMPVDGDVLGEALQLAEQLLERAAVPGSVLVMADSVAPSQVQTVAATSFASPVQFLAMSSPSAPPDSGMQDAAAALKAPVVRLSVDQTDVERVAQRAQSRFKATAGLDGGDRWRDAGYGLLPLIAVLALMWSRRGWLLR